MKVKIGTSLAPRVFKTHLHPDIPPFIAYLWLGISRLDPRRWPALSRLSLADLKTLFDRLDVYQHGDSIEGAAQRRQFCHALKRFGAGSPELKTIAVEKFVETEANLSWDPSENLLSGLNAILRDWLKDLKLEDLPYQHGPGAVAEPKSSGNAKWLCAMNERDPLIDYVYRDLRVYGPCKPVDRTSRLVVVPKTSWKARTICAEPAILQFLQQGVQKRLYDYISRHRYLRNRIPLRDQGVNQALAQISSLDRDRDDFDLTWTPNSLVTLDLSEASDRLPWDVVKRVFRGTPLLRHLWATRSQRVRLPDDTVVVLKKFAPMGSALCFPIQSLVYAAVLEYNARLLPCSYRTYSAYGDDLIFHVNAYDGVVRDLVSLGLKVNYDKSFLPANPLKESCGGDFFLGVDITPLKLRSVGSEPYAILGLLDQLSKIWELNPDCGKRLRTFIRSVLPKHVNKQLNIGENYGVEEETSPVAAWSVDWQRPLISQLVPVVRPETMLTDEHAYLSWLLRARRSGRHVGWCAKHTDASRVVNVRPIWV